MTPPPTHAGTNRALGGIGGIDNGTFLGGDGTGRAQITINAVDLALVKQARDLDGNVLPDGSDVTPGQEIYFVLYVDNPTDHPLDDIRITDPLDENQFSYITNTLQMTVVASGADASGIWSGSWLDLTDDLGSPDDEGSAENTGGRPGPDRITVGSTAGQINQSASVPGRSLLAIRFRVRVN